MWIVELALRRPHTFIVMAITIALFGVLSAYRMAVDIFPEIDIPVVSCVWTYAGMSSYYMENMVTFVTERSLTSTVNGIQHMESLSLPGMSIIKVYLNQGTPIGQSVAMVTSVGTALLRALPRGISPPFVTASSATDVPVIQLGLISDTLSEAKLFDIADNIVRSQLATVQGTITPFPYGGKFRQVVVDLNPQALIATNLSANDVVKALNAQSVVAPTGTVKMGPFEYLVTLNNVPNRIDELNYLPVKSEKGAVVFVRDVAFVHDGYQPQLNVVNLNGKRAVLFNILKSGKASTLDVVDRIKKALPHIRSIVPPECRVEILVDQSQFVRECVGEVVREALIACGLTALMMLLLLGSWQSTLIVATSIPLAMLAAIICLNIAGQTINSMTLGGLALAVGMLVDDATVTIENLHRNLAMGKDIIRAILDGAEQVALPAMVSTLSICIVFVPLLFLSEPSHSLFVPLGMAVVFSMLASYGLSRTIVPLMSKYLIVPPKLNEPESVKPKSAFASLHLAIEKKFEWSRQKYTGALGWVLDSPGQAALLFLLFYAISFCLVPFIGREYFPEIDSGELRLHVNAHAGTRVEETERLFKRIENALAEVIPQKEIRLVTDNIGLPVSGVNFAYSDSQTISEADGEILIALSDKRSHSTSYYQKKVRGLLKKQFPECTSYFQPADIVTQILNAGLPAPIDVKILGYKKEQNYEVARKIRYAMEKVPGAVDVCLHQVVDAPHFGYDVDRIRAAQVGLTQKDVSNSFLISLSSSFQTQPNFWPAASGIVYNLAAQTPQYKIGSLADMNILAVTGIKTNDRINPELLTNLARPSRSPTPAVVNHLNVQPEFDIYAACEGRDLGGVSGDIAKIVDQFKKELPRGSLIFMAGQVLSMNLAFIALICGLAFAVILVYLLLVVNFQSWTDPLIILMAIPGAFSGIAWSLYVTQTNFSIPALMGTIMTVGVASANSILLVTFANQERAEGKEARQAAFAAGAERFRPVIMTASAMIIGMIPMAIGAGAGGSQNAPIGRAVIGGLCVATFSTLLFVPLIFSEFRGKWFKEKQG